MVPFLKYHGIRRLDAIAVSHGDQDHVNGIQYLLETPECGISVGALVLPDDGALDETEAELIDLAKERDIPVVLKHAGESMDGVLGEDVKIRCLHPYGPGNGDRNENSLVLQVEYQEFRMLLTGDAGEIAEARMLQQEVLGPVTVLKAGHHGSATSTGRGLLEKICPKHVILSYGEGNSYRHPSARVVEECRNMGACLHETARSGAIHIWTDGNNMQITGWLDIRNGI